MQTLTAEQFKKKYGGVPTAPKVESPSFFENLKAQYLGGGEKVVKGFETVKQGAQSKSIMGGAQDMLRGATSMASGAIQTAFSPLTAGVQEVAETKPVATAFKATQEKVVSPVSNIISQSPALQKFAMENPNAEEVIADLINIVGTATGGNQAKNVVANTGSKVKNIVGQTADTLTDATTNSIDNVSLSKASDLLTPIDQGVETVLNPTKIIPKEKLASIPQEKLIAQAETKTTKLNNYIKQAEKAVSDYSQKTPLSVAGDKAGEALTVIQNKLSKQSQLKKDALGKVGDKIVSNIQDVRNLFAKELEDKVGLKLVDDANESLINLVEGKGMTTTNAAGRKSKIAFDPSDNKLIKDANQVLRDLGDSPTVREIDDTVDALQDLLYKRNSLTAVPVNTQVQAILKNITGKLNRSVKNVAGEQYTKANAKMAYMMDTLNTLNKSLGKEGERGATLMKQLFSPTGEKPRRLFAEIKKLTGIDLVEEATLAKFVMENVGDARQASLLEEVIRGRTLSPKSLAERAFDFSVNKLQDPIGKARRIINQPLNEAPIKVNTNQIKNANIAKGGDNTSSIKNNAIPAIPKTVTPKVGVVKKTVDKVKNALGANIPNKQGGFVKLPTRNLEKTAQQFLNKKPPAGLLADLERFIDYVRLKKNPDTPLTREMSNADFEANIRDVLRKDFKVNADISNSALARWAEEVLRRAKY